MTTASAASRSLNATKNKALTIEVELELLPETLTPAVVNVPTLKLAVLVGVVTAHGIGSHPTVRLGPYLPASYLTNFDVLLKFDVYTASA